MLEKTQYQSFEGYLSYDQTTQKRRPTILVAPTWMGLNPFIQKKTEEIAELGYLSFAIDLFGEGKQASDHYEAREWIAPLVEDRQRIRDRMQLALEHIRQHPLVDPERIAAVGFCFGGGCVLEFARSGADLKGVVSFHAVLGNPYNLPMNTLKAAPKIPASILMLNGYKDPLASQEDLSCFEKELSSRGAEWQVVTYGDAMHAFTNPNVQKPELGMQYHAKSSARAWQAMKNFLEEIFSAYGP